MRTNKFLLRKKSAQAMVEFAIALPILLLLLYGILEAGRLLFMYSTVVTASRQAVRYGATTGENASGTPRYNDCAGIVAAAQKAAYISPGGFDAVEMQWDKGPGTTTNDQCDPNGVLTTANLNGNSTRLVVTVKEQFVPLVPKLVPFIQREIVATSARTILYSVPIVMDREQTGFEQQITSTTITMDTPDPSEINQPVTVTIVVAPDPSEANPTMPTGTVLITVAGSAADVSGCGGQAGVALTNGTATCTVVFTEFGAPLITATYSGDDEHLPSTDNETHSVSVAPTTTTITFIIPNPATRNQNISVTVNVSGGASTPTGTVDVDGGGNNRCTISLVNGAGSCSLSFNNLGLKTITATYNGDTNHLTSSDTATVEILDGTATPSNTPTITPTAPTATATLSPTATLPATVTPSPTATATALPNCNLTTVSSGTLVISGTMSMTIINQTGAPLLVSNVFVDWYNEKGHRTGGDKTLKLRTATLAGVTFYNGNLYASSTTITPTNLYIPTGTSTIVFTFHQTYDTVDNNERIIISLATNGCSGVTIDSQK